jgi:hypothetical protein
MFLFLFYFWWGIRLKIQPMLSGDSEHRSLNGGVQP